jgi:hypothetical protein
MPSFIASIMVWALTHLFSFQTEVTSSCLSIDENGKVVTKIKIVVISLHVRI